MRTTAEECAELGQLVAEKLNAATGPTALHLPLEGVSMIDVESQPFHDPEADRALFDAIRETVDGGVELVEMETDVNDEAFARAMAERLDAYMQEAEGRVGEGRAGGPGVWRPSTALGPYWCGTGAANHPQEVRLRSRTPQDFQSAPRGTGSGDGREPRGRGRAA
jgi:hypothetical protein